MSPRSILMGASVGAGLFEIANAPFLDMAGGKVMALIFAGLFLSAAWSLRRWATGPAIGLLLLFGLELAFLPMYDRATTTDWLLQGGFGGLSIVGLVAAVGVLATRRQATTGRAQALRTTLGR